ncbi:MAG: hypothetical protein Q9202_005795 [Teloschistes flavicans]
MASGGSSIEDPERVAMLAELAQLRAASRPTTLREMLRACHESYHQCLAVETDMTKTTRGGLTKPEGRKRPAGLRPWLDFDKKLSQAFRFIDATLHTADGKATRAFRSMTAIESWSSHVQRSKIASENDLRDYLKHYVDGFVTDICDAVGKPLSVNNTPHGIGLDIEDSRKSASGPQTPDRSRKPPKIINADRFAVSSGVGADTRLVTVAELKAPHKLSMNILDLALERAESIDLGEMVEELTVYTEDPDKSIQEARRLFAIVATQTYDYMLDGRCLYGCIATGEATVFLKIDEHRSQVLYYHLARPSQEVAGGSGQGFNYDKTSIAQLASFYFLAMDDPPPCQDWFEQAIVKAPVWKVDYNVEWGKTPTARRQELKKYERKDRAFSGSRVGEIDRSPVATRSTKRCKTDTHCADDRGSDDEGRRKADQRTSLPGLLPKILSQSQQQEQSSRPTTSSNKKQQQRPYCTQTCLLSLVKRRPIDQACPNAQLHPRRRQSNLHSLTREELCNLLREQLRQSRDENCDDLWIQGSRGMLFKLSLASHGYSFVGKATIKHWIPEFLHEAETYEHLQDLQGDLIPVYLGSIDLVKPYYAFCTVLVHILLLSYGGERLKGDNALDGLENQLRHFEDTITARGVRHLDLEPRNMLWNEELGRLMFIDFERSIIDTDAVSNPPGSPQAKVSQTQQPKTTDRGRKRKALQELIPPPGALNKKAKTQGIVSNLLASPLKPSLEVKGVSKGKDSYIIAIEYPT